MSILLLVFSLVSLTSSSEITTHGVCGNGIRDPGEQCDDGNLNSYDGCSSSCTIEVNYLCVPDPQSSQDICYQDTPLTAELNYVAHSSPPKVELRFNHPIVYRKLSNMALTMFVQIGQDFNGSIFTWTLEENPNYIHRNQSFFLVIAFQESVLKRTFTLTFFQPAYVRDIFNKSLSTGSCVLSTKVPSMVIFSETSQSFIRFSKGLFLSVMVVMLIFCLPLSIVNSLGIFWNLFDSCQLFQILALVNCDYPDPIKEFFKGFSVTNFRLLEYFHEDLDHQKKYQENPELPYWFSDRFYGTMFIGNAFYALLFVGLFLSGFLILELLSRFHANPGSWPTRLKNLFGFSMVIRTTLITYTPLALATMLQLTNFRFGNKTNNINSMLALICLFYLIFLPLLYLKLLNHKEVLAEDENFRGKIRPLIELLNIKAILKRNFQIFYTIRKFFWVVFIISLGSDVLSQIFGVTLLQVSIITLFILKKPYNDKPVNYMLLTTEMLLLFTLFLIAILISFDYLNADMNLNVRVGISWGIVGCLSAIVFIKLMFMIIEIAKNLRYLIPKAKRMFRKFDDDDNFIEMGEYTSKNAEGTVKTLTLMETSGGKSPTKV